MKKIIVKPFDRERTPPPQSRLFLPFIWLFSYFATRKGKLKIKKINIKGLKPPFVVFANHQAFLDFAVTPLALFPYRANYISELEGFECYGGEFYRHLGALGTRKFINDMALIKNIRAVIKRGDIIVIYPEARYTNIGTGSYIPDSVGKLCKMLNVPVVTLNMKGNYLRTPIWNTRVRKGVTLRAELKLLYTVKQLESLDAKEITEGIIKDLAFNEYEYQLKNKIKIDDPRRAEGIEKVLYKCPNCSGEFTTFTKGADIICSECRSTFTLSEYGEILAENKTISPPDWYEWQRQQVIDEIATDKYHFKGRVRIEALPNEYNFINLGEGVLEHNKNGFYLTLTPYGENKPQTLFFSSGSCPSIHTEYNYRGKGECIVLSTPDNSYFIYPVSRGFNPTKLQFATEYLYSMVHEH